MRFAFDDDGSRSFGDDSDETDLDRDFPLGDGTADTSADVTCPYCGETNTVGVDPGSGDVQSYVEDCQVCCKPNILRVSWDLTAGEYTISAELE